MFCGKEVLISSECLRCVGRLGIFVHETRAHTHEIICHIHLAFQQPPCLFLEIELIYISNYSILYYPCVCCVFVRGMMLGA